MRNVKIIVEYDGTRYAGWQRQKSDATIQQQIEQAVCAITSVERATVHGSGRTDAGVHAIGQVANFHTESAIPIGSFPPALNTHLPEDIVVTDAAEMDAEFHARFSAVSKRYRYTIARRRHPSPVERLYTLCVPDRLDLQAMTAAAAVLVGEHDFSAFASKSAEDQNNVRQIQALDLIEEDPHLLIDVRANGFLYNMVRTIAGTLLEVGRGKVAAARVEEILSSGARAMAGPTAPAKGLCLMEVAY